MDKDQIAKACKDIFDVTTGQSVFAIEEKEGMKYVAEYQIRRYIRDDMSADKIDDSIQSLDQQKADMIEIKDSLTA